MPQPEDETIAIMVEADKITSLIRTARSLLEDGKLVDLSALEGKVADLCRRFSNIPPKATETFRATIKDIMADLDLLATELARQNEKVLKARPGSSPRHAATAYERDD